MKTVKGLTATALALASTACLQLPDTAATSYGATHEPYRTSAVSPILYQPPPYQPPPLSSTLPSAPPTSLSGVAGSSGGTPVRYLLPQPISSTSLITPTAPSTSASLIGPQRVDWKPGGGF